MQVTNKTWRVGRKVGRTVYVQLGKKPSDADVLIGLMDTEGLANEVVQAHNERLSRRTSSEEEK